MSNKWKKERSSFSQGSGTLPKASEETPIELSSIPEDQRSEINSMITDIRKSINDALDYFSKIDKAGVFASPVFSILFHVTFIGCPSRIYQYNQRSARFAFNTCKYNEI